MPAAFRRARFLFLALSCFLAPGALAQSQVVDITVHSAGLEHNLLGDPADQPVAVYLPEAYSKELQRRFSTLYFLHGYGDSGSRHQTAELFRKIMDQLIAKGSAQPMIVVVPNGVNKYRGSFYANSATTGNWDDYIVHDVVGYVDSHYRTVASAGGRGIAGHSMGGYGALTLSFRHPDVFSAVYAMSPCCTDLVGDLGPSNPAWGRIGALQSPEEVPAALRDGQFFVAADSAMLAAQGARHNRGCAVDLALYDLRTGKPVAMPSGYDEMSDRAFPQYSGGTPEETRHRDLLRRVMEANGFTVYEFEWWHYDYKDWSDYAIGNEPFSTMK